MAERFGRYWLHEKIGQGGMAEVFRATIGPDPQTFGFDLALKRMHARLESDRNKVDMFLTEADIAKLLTHPNLVRVFENGLVQGRAYIAMEYLRGWDLAQLLRLLIERSHSFPVDLAVYVALQVLRALDYVHRARSSAGVSLNLVHRDVSPSNIYVTSQGEVKLGDFGVAHVSFLEPMDAGPVVKGKVAYLPPEALQGEPVEQAVDIWGIATVLYEMLTLQRAYDLLDSELLVGAIPPPIQPAQRINPSVDAQLSKILARALSFRRKKRPRSALLFYRDLKLYLRNVGAEVDQWTVARFLGDLAGAKSEQRAAQPGEQDFVSPEYHVPLGPSPTQLFEQVDRRRARLLPLLIGGGVLAAAGAGIGIYQLVTNQSEVSPSPSPETSDRVAASVKPEPGEIASPPVMEPMVEESNVEPSIEPPATTDGSDLEGNDPELAKLDLKTLVQKGRQHLRAKRHQEALQAFAAATRKRPESPAAVMGQASALMALEQHQHAEALLVDLTQRRPGLANGFRALGDAYRVQGKVAQARVAYERCIEIEPKGKAARAARKALAGL